ncbi:MAG: hypothetical protein JO192_00085, partial [Candidatus Eremiobacteraeota bacterium]|nr:hypothetical protein [Candidatus Eremiobacteraeota bacterium]
MKPAPSPIDALAAIVASVNAAAHDPSALPALLSTLERAPAFESAALFCSARHNKSGFVCRDARGCASGSERAWVRWPLRRLYGAMRPRLIAHPDRPARALAIPFDYGNDRSVVLAVIAKAAACAAYEPFFTTLENLQVPVTSAARIVPDGIPIVPLDPRVYSFDLCGGLESVLREMLWRRGWGLQSASSFRELRVKLEAGEPDLLLVDLDRLPTATETVFRLHGMLSEETKVIAFGGQEHEQLCRQGLLDARVDHDAPEPAIFDCIKHFVRMVPDSRKARIDHVASVAEGALLSTRTPTELSTVAAQSAATLMRGWASVHFVSDGGAVFTSEHPRLLRPVMGSIPKAFLNDVPVFSVCADDRFYEQTCDDVNVRTALAQIGAVSGASIPLRRGERRVGALVSVSCDEPVDASAFEALAGVANVMTRRFDEFALASPLATPYERHGVWEYIRHGGLEFAVYRSRNSAVTWDYRPLGLDRGILCVGTAGAERSLERLVCGSGDESERHFLDAMTREGTAFVAVCKPITGTVRYAARGFPAPLLFDACGPSGTVAESGGVLRGNVTVVPPVGLLVW